MWQDMSVLPPTSISKAQGCDIARCLSGFGRGNGHEDNPAAQLSVLRSNTTRVRSI